MCDRVAWLEAGRVAALGPADEIVDRYLAVS
jgi:ABC-type polysaccharide/polyol phosphate transport system ATPase subunit